MEPADHIDPPKWMRTTEVQKVLAALSSGGAPVRFVGGCVRDAVLGRQTKDVDLATPEPPQRVLELLAGAGIRAIPTGIEHGTVTAVVGREHFEITTLRRDISTDGRHATVAFTDDWVEDAARRDFTINALFCDADGTLFDPMGGLADIETGTVRFVGDAATRIEEDHLRILRFFRFFAHYGKGEADADGLAACTRLAPTLKTLSAERIAAEILGLLAAPGPAPTVSLMAEAGVMAQILPEATHIGALGNLCAAEEEAGGMAELGAGARADPLRRLAALLGAPSGPDGDLAGSVAARLKLSNAQAKRLTQMMAPGVTIAAHAPEPELRRALYKSGRDGFTDLVLLTWAQAGDAGDAFSGHLASTAKWTVPRFPLRGDDALELGVPHGPRVGELLSEVEAWWIEGGFTAGREECLARLRELS